MSQKREHPKLGDKRERLEMKQVVRANDFSKAFALSKLMLVACSRFEKLQQIFFMSQILNADLSSTTGSRIDLKSQNKNIIWRVAGTCYVIAEELKMQMETSF